MIVSGAGDAAADAAGALALAEGTGDGTTVVGTTVAADVTAAWSAEGLSHPTKTRTREHVATTRIARGIS
jgi:hypothetical protein